MAVLMNHTSANTRDSSTAVRKVPGASTAARIGAAVGVSPSGATRSWWIGSRDALGTIRFKGMPSAKCSAAQPRQAPRQPHCVSNQADSGQPTVLAKPAIRVMPVIALRES